MTFEITFFGYGGGLVMVGFIAGSIVGVALRALGMMGR